MDDLDRFLEGQLKDPDFAEEWERSRPDYMENTHCQSCGMPFDDGHRELVAKEPDGSDSIYCTYCYQDGAFTDPGATVQGMVEVAVPHLAHKIGEQAARK
ncbi:MAG: zinc ribbon domain-containing protein, partial [Eggerthellaceae bacterium]|nr:zinc ribbon domain-containing protein [Eggerthellaceae bacterium]